MKLEIKGMDKLSKELGRIGTEIKPALVQATRRAILYVHSEVPPYPPPPPLSTYRRTEKMGASISTEVRELGSTIVGVIGTPIVYAPWVISDQAVGKRGPQAWMHKGRWWTLQGVVMKAKDVIVKIYEQAVHDLIK